MSNSILITGAAGFIGSYLSRALARRGDRVVGIDNFHDYYAREAKVWNLDLIRLSIGQTTATFPCEKLALVGAMLDEWASLPKPVSIGDFSFHEADIADPGAIREIFEREEITKIVHLAALAGVPSSVKRPIDYSHVNVTGTTVLWELAREYGVKGVVFGSSSSVYGGRRNVPFRETDSVDKPISPYAATKRMGELLCWTYHRLYSIPTTIVRIFGPVFGPLQRPYGMAAQRFIKQVDHDEPITIYGDGSMSRDSTYIDDEVEGLILALDAELPFEVFNIGTGNPVSVEMLADSIIKKMGRGEKKYVDKPATEVPITYADVTKAHQLLGYRPRVEFLAGLDRQIKVYRAMPAWYKDLPG
jgi:UDP-glucuronate 4-epimerase